MKIHRLSFVGGLLIVLVLVVVAIGMSLDDDSQVPTVTPQIPLLTPSNGMCELVAYTDAIALTNEGEPTFELLQGTHTLTDGLTAGFDFYRIHERRNGATVTAFVRVGDVVPIDATCLQALPTLNERLPQMSTATP